MFGCYDSVVTLCLSGCGHVGGALCWGRGILNVKHDEVAFACPNQEVGVAEVKGSKLRYVSHWYFCSAKCTEEREGGREGEREGGRKGEREGREGGRKGEREGGRERGRGEREGGNVRIRVPTEF